MGFFTALFGAIAASEEASKKRKRSNLEKEISPIVLKITPRVLMISFGVIA